MGEVPSGIKAIKNGANINHLCHLLFPIVSLIIPYWHKFVKFMFITNYSS